MKNNPQRLQRKFAEETGILTPTDMTFLKLDKHPFERNGQPYHINRNCYHATVSDDLPETWDPPG